MRRNFQKLGTGASASLKSSTLERSKLVRTFYNPLWEEDIYRAHDLFRRLAAVRNALMEKPLDFATSDVEEGLWTAARIHQYPTGGGFMGAHRDRIGTDVLDGKSLNYYQVLLALSQKGVDFETGGGFVEHEDRTICFEDFCKPGDILIYDSQTLHGVADVDPHKNLDLDQVCGRIVAFASLYRDL